MDDTEEENAKKRAASIYYPPEERHTQHRYSFGITMMVRSVHQVERSITSHIAGRFFLNDKWRKGEWEETQMIEQRAKRSRS